MKPILILFFYFQTFFTFAQNDTTYFHSIDKSTFSKVRKTSPKADLFTIDQLKDSCHITLYNIKSKQKYGDFNLTKSQKNGLYLSEGETIFYYSNSNIKEKGVYKEGNKKTGKWQSFYQNGLPKEVINFDEELLANDYYKNHFFHFKILDYWNNSGEKLVENGNGLYSYIDSSEMFTAQVKNGLLNGFCTGTYRGFHFKEEYKKGIFQGGEIVSDGKRIKYDIISEAPSFYGGTSKLYDFIRENLRLPESALKANKKGKVFITFNVDIDSSITDVIISKGFWKDCDQEALRVIQLTNGNWQSGRYRGIKEKIKLTIPIVFN